MEQHEKEKLIKDVSLLLKDLLKVIKVVSMYPESNPLPQSLRQSFAEKFERTIIDYGDLHLYVEKEELKLGDTVVFHDKSKEEALAGIFFDTGVTGLSFTGGFDCVGVYRFLDAIKKYLNTPGKTADMASLLWEAEIVGFSFTTAQDIELAEFDGEFRVMESGMSKDSQGIKRSVFGYDQALSYEQIFEPKNGREVEANEISFADSSKVDSPDTSDAPSRQGSGTAAPRSGGGRSGGSGSGSGVSGGRSVSGGGGSISAESASELLFSVSPDESSRLRISELADAMGISDIATSRVNPVNLPDTKLILNDQFKLSEEEQEIITKLLREDAEFDDYESTVELLKEMLLQEPQMQEFYETVSICEKVMGDFIAQGKLIHASQILSYMKELDDRIRKDRPLWAERLKDAVTTSGSREKLKRLAQAMNDHPDLGTIEIKKYIEQFGWEALAGITDMMAELIHPQHKQVISEALARLGGRHVEIVAKGIHEKRADSVRNAITILVQIGTDHAIGYARHALKHDDQSVRLHLVTSLCDCASRRTIEILKEAAQDKDAEVRSAAVTTLVKRKGADALDAVTTIINSERFGELERSEQQELMNAYSILGEESSVEYLVGLAQRLNIANDQNVSFFREAAFTALTMNSSDQAGDALIRLSRSWRTDVKAKAVESIKKRREYLYGGA